MVLTAGSNPTFDALRSDHRFQVLGRRVDLAKRT